MSYELLIDTDNTVRVRGVKNDATGEWVNDAIVELTLLDSAGVEISGQSWPLELDYVAGSDGDYVGTVQDTIVVLDGDTGTARLDIDGDGLQKRIDLAVTFRLPTVTVLGWTSTQELYDMFGRNNVRKWADLDNDIGEESDADTPAVVSRIRASIDAATEDARMRLLDGPFDPDSAVSAPTPLRDAVTRLAGVRLYEARGVVDTADEEGRHRLSSHKKQADLFFRRVNASQLRLGVSAKGYPAIIGDDGCVNHIEDESSSTLIVNWPQ